MGLPLRVHKLRMKLNYIRMKHPDLKFLKDSCYNEIAILYGTSYSILLTHMISLFKMNSFSLCLSKYDKLYDEWCCKLKNNIYSLKKEDANEKCQKFSR